MMQDNEDTKRYSLAELLSMKQNNDFVPTRKDAECFSVDEKFWHNAQITLPQRDPKIHTGIRLDADMLTWFKSQGKGWQTMINSVLRSYYESHTPK